MLKVNPHPDYPPEEGRYVRGSHFSPVAVAIILNCEAEKIPREIESLVRAGVEAGSSPLRVLSRPKTSVSKR